MFVCFFFFFSSRRRHTRCLSDWSSDVCSSDLSGVTFIDSAALGVLIEARTRLPNRRGFLLAAPGLETRRALEISRSEERRVGKECGSRWGRERLERD